MDLFQTPCAQYGRWTTQIYPTTKPSQSLWEPWSSAYPNKQYQLDHPDHLTARPTWPPWTTTLITLITPTNRLLWSLQPLWPPRPWTFSKFTEKTSWTICKFCNKVMQNAKLQKFFKKNVCYDNLHLSGKTICKICFRNVNLQKSCPECQIAKNNRFNICSNYLIIGQWFNNG